MTFDIVLPPEIWEHILAFLKPTEEFMPAMVCRDFYDILKAKRTKRGQAVWVTDITVFCKTPEWAKFIILTSRQDLQGNWAIIPRSALYRNRSEFKLINVYGLIEYIALCNGYYETHKFIIYILHHEKTQTSLDYTLELPANNYGFLRTMLDDLVPVKSSAFIRKVIETLNLPLIRALLTNNPEINKDACLHYGLPNADTVLDYACKIIYARQRQIDISNAREILKFVADMYGKYCKKSGSIKYTLDDYILTRTQLRDIIFLHEVIGVPGHHSIAFLALEKDRLDVLEYTLEKKFPLSKKVATTIITKFPTLATKYNIVAGTDDSH